MSPVGSFVDNYHHSHPSYYGNTKLYPLIHLPDFLWPGLNGSGQVEMTDFALR